MARESTRGSVGLSESGRFLPVDLRVPRYAIEQSAARDTKRTSLDVFGAAADPPLLSNSPELAFSVS